MGKLFDYICFFPCRLFYKMDLDKDPFRKSLGINVLEGLVKVRVKKDPFKIKNNVFVSVAGVPLWMQ